MPSQFGKGCHGNDSCASIPIVRILVMVRIARAKYAKAKGKRQGQLGSGGNGIKQGDFYANQCSEKKEVETTEANLKIGST